MQLLERLQYHIQKLNEGNYFWNADDTGGKLECVFDPTPKELQDFLKDYPICKTVSNGKGQWIFASGQKIYHDTLDKILSKKSRKVRFGDDHLSVTRQGLILGFREAGSCEALLSGIFDYELNDEEFNKQICLRDLKSMLEILKSLRTKYSWLKPSPSLIEELLALKNAQQLEYKDGGLYRW